MTKKIKQHPKANTNKKLREKDLLAHDTAANSTDTVATTKTDDNLHKNHAWVDSIKQRCRLQTTQLKRYSDSQQLPTTTNSAPHPMPGFGQPRVVHALSTATHIQATGYHVFAVGENGLGKRTFISHYLANNADLLISLHKKRDTASLSDWVYVHNFRQPHAPLTCTLPAGNSQAMIKEIANIWYSLQQTLLCAYFPSLSSTKKAENSSAKQTPNYQLIAQECLQPLFDALWAAYPTLKNYPKFSAHLNTIKTDMIGHAETILLNLIENLYGYADLASDAYSNFENNHNHNNHNHDNYNNSEEAPTFTSPSSFADPNNTSIKQRWLKEPDTLKRHKLEILMSIYNEQNHSSNHCSTNDHPINNHSKGIFSTVFLALPIRYTITVMVDQATNKQEHNTPLVFEPLPTASRLLGDIEHTYYKGTHISDMSMIKAGALHRANGGYLLVEAGDLLAYPEAWQVLKQAIKSRQIDIPMLQRAQQPNLSGQLLTLTPQPIPLTVKVILLGDESTYDAFVELDEEFTSVFKIRADFHDELTRTLEHEQAMTAKMASIIAKHHLAPFDASAQALVLEELSLQAENQNKLSLHSDRLIQLLLEADHHAQLTACELTNAVKQAPKNDDNEAALNDIMVEHASGKDNLTKDYLTKNNLTEEIDTKKTAENNVLNINSNSSFSNDLSSNRDTSVIVSAVHVKQALYDMGYRASYLKELYWQELTDGQQLISITDAAIGQINALTVIEYANDDFGMPARLTAVVQHSTGSGDILDIERDVELGGSLHAKGMLIMNSYLRALFSPYHPLNFTASLAFEQSYAHIDGDSATLAEACALLSALADVPISQALAITGSMNQLGMVQAVGGVNTKIVGFFETCQQQGFTGKQGIILPKANMTNLMLRDDIIEKVRKGQFHIYGVTTLSEALTILADMPVDTMTKKGRYHKKSVFGRIITNLAKWEAQLNPQEEEDTLHSKANKAH